MKNVRLAGRYLLLYAIVFGVTVGVVSLACMPAWMARAGVAVGAGWIALRYIAWRCFR